MAEAVGAATSNSAADFILTKKVVQDKTQLGKDDFLKILLTQLQNQDPTSPVENIDSIAQMAQFSALEAMTNLTTSFGVSQAYSMIGKGVLGVIVDPISGYRSEIIGTADSAGVEGGLPYVMIGGQRVMAENITQVFDNSIIAGETNVMIAGTAMVGKYARATMTDNGATNYIEGRVERMTVIEGKLFLVIDGAEVPLNQIVTVAETLSGLGQIGTV